MVIAWGLLHSFEAPPSGCNPLNEICIDIMIDITTNTLTSSERDSLEILCPVECAKDNRTRDSESGVARLGSRAFFDLDEASQYPFPCTSSHC